jgi:hypothetical protein
MERYVEGASLIRSATKKKNALASPLRLFSRQLRFGDQKIAITNRSCQHFFSTPIIELSAPK